MDMMDDTVFGTKTWDRGCGSTTSWSSLSTTWVPEIVVEVEIDCDRDIGGNTCSGKEILA